MSSWTCTIKQQHGCYIDVVLLRDGKRWVSCAISVMFGVNGLTIRGDLPALLLPSCHCRYLDVPATPAHWTSASPATHKRQATTTWETPLVLATGARKWKGKHFWGCLCEMDTSVTLTVSASSNTVGHCEHDVMTSRELRNWLPILWRLSPRKRTDECVMDPNFLCMLCNKQEKSNSK